VPQLGTFVSEQPRDDHWRIDRCLAKLALDRGHVRLDWVALEWNEPALDFYDKLGARRLDDWRMLRLEMDGIRRLVGEGDK